MKTKILIGGISFIFGGVAGFFLNNLILKKKREEDLDKAFLDGQNDILEQQYDSALGKNSKIDSVEWGEETSKEVEYVLKENNKILDFNDAGKNIVDGMIHGLDDYKIKDDPTVVTEDDFEEIVEGSPVAEEINNIFEKYKDGGEKVDYSAKGEQLKAEEEYPGEIEKMPDIQIITEDDYVNSFQSYAKHSLIYYTDDDVLFSEDTESVVPYINETVGDACNRFGEKSDDPDMVFVRNHRLGEDYDIVKKESSYSEEVLGIDDEYDKYSKGNTHRRRRDDFN